MSTMFSEASPELLRLAQELITKYHPHLLEARVGFVFRETAQRTNGKEVLGAAQKMTEKLQVAGLDLDFIIWVSAADWTKMTIIQKQALLDHELCHCLYEDGEARIRPHDFEEFKEVIERWGLWHSSLWLAKPAIEKALQMDFVELRRQGAVLTVNVQDGLAQALE